MVSLELACQFFGITSPKDGSIKASGVASAYAEGRIAEITEYCLRDVVATSELYKMVHQYY